MTPAPAEKPRIPRPVWFLGLTSLFTDAATEMIYPLLPVYLSRVLGAGALSLGIIEGVAEGVNSLLKVLCPTVRLLSPAERHLVDASGDLGAIGGGSRPDNYLCAQ